MIGITGNIGCGKSTVASLLNEYPSIHVFDTDSIAKQILLDETHQKIIEGILSISFMMGGPDLSGIARAIFGDLEKKKNLEAYIHPLVWEYIEAEIKKLEPGVIPIVESAILYECGSESRFQKIIVVTCPEDVQVERLMKHRNMTIEQIESRKKHQLSTQEKEQKADYVIDTDCTLLELEQKAHNLYLTLTEL